MQTIEQIKIKLQQADDAIDRLRDEKAELEKELNSKYIEVIRKEQLLAPFKWELVTSGQHAIVLSVYDVESKAFENLCHALGKEPSAAKMDHFYFEFGSSVHLSCDDGSLELKFRQSAALTPIEIFKPFTFSHGIKANSDNLEAKKSELRTALKELSDMQAMFKP